MLLLRYRPFVQYLESTASAYPHHITAPLYKGGLIYMRDDAKSGMLFFFI